MKDCILRERLRKKKMSEDGREHDMEDNPMKKMRGEEKSLLFGSKHFLDRIWDIVSINSGSWNCLISSSINY